MADIPMEPRDFDADMKKSQRPNASNRQSATLMSVASSALTHPLSTLSRTLMQVGYEPVEAKPGLSLFLRERHNYYPNLFAYTWHLRKTEGIVAIYSGLKARILSIVATTMVEEFTKNTLKENFPYRGSDEKLPSRMRCFIGMLHEVTLECITKAMGVVASQPFHVVMVRMIVALINKDQAYRGFFHSVREIYNTEGLSGFFSGLVPRLGAEVISVAATGIGVWCIYRLLERAGIEDEAVDQMDSNWSGALQFLWHSYVYPFNVTATVYATSCSGLTHNTRRHLSWQSCYSYLKHTNQLFRGQSAIYRIAYKPIN